jgi:hypothetical protein
MQEFAHSAEAGEMAVFTVPTSSGEDVFPNYQLEVELDGVSFKLDLVFNSRQQTWFFNLLDANAVILRAGIPIVTGFPLLARMVQQSRPVGTLMAVAVAGDIDAATLEQLGLDVLLTYSGNS